MDMYGGKATCDSHRVTAVDMYGGKAICVCSSCHRSFHLHPAQPVSVLIPSRQISSVVTNYETEIHTARIIQQQAKGGFAMQLPTAMDTRATHMQATTAD